MKKEENMNRGQKTKKECQNRFEAPINFLAIEI